MNNEQEVLFTPNDKATSSPRGIYSAQADSRVYHDVDPHIAETYSY
jgi:hypothetical protein